MLEHSGVVMRPFCGLAIIWLLGCTSVPAFEGRASTPAQLSDVEQIELAATRFFMDSGRLRDRLVQIALLTDSVGEYGWATQHRSPGQSGRLAALVGRTVGSYRQATVCSAEAPTTCRLPPSHAVVALGKARIDGDQAEIPVWSWRGTGTACYPMQQLVEYVALRRVEGAWKVTGLGITRIGAGRAC